ncbi:hypothetical protein J2Z62_000804 [Mycoplasmoides fastidiosum]|uniref:Uncharacterized protein n=1 Tax=Mycoplasmoides fastidiosum TaxID=92758 RepID=A0ABU0M095_9BACT|nr:hypothetical protein [Mycoplasmoides fastidiosum]
MNRTLINNGYDFWTQVLGQLLYYNGCKNDVAWPS